jgi:very-short-patch-repair endonuclease
MKRERFHRNNVPAARRLRRETTRAETLLWEKLRDGRVGYKFRRQHAIGPFVVDFYCHAFKVAIEIDGGIHGNPEVAARDALRQESLEGQGLVFLRFANEDVERSADDVVERIMQFLEHRRGVIPPSPAAREKGSGG